MESSTKSAIIKSVVLLVLGAIVVAGIYFALTRGKKSGGSEEYQLTAVDEITTIELDKTYPADARKVVELYAQIMRVLYNEKYNDTQEEKMLSVLAGIMDDELMANQINFNKSMSNEIESRKKDGYTFSTYQVQNYEPDVVTVDGKKMCDVDCFFSLMENNSRINMYYTFYLRRDADKRWKILGWEMKQDSN